jgi:hypothetical protein
MAVGAVALHHDAAAVQVVGTARALSLCAMFFTLFLAPYPESPRVNRKLRAGRIAA